MIHANAAFVRCRKPSMPMLGPGAPAALVDT